MKKTAFICIADSQEKHDAYIKKVNETIPELNILMRQEVDEFNAGVDKFNADLEASDKTAEEKMMKKSMREYTTLDSYEFVVLTIGDVKPTETNERIIRFLPDNDIELALNEGNAPFGILNAARHLVTPDAEILFYLCSCEMENFSAQLFRSRLYPFETNPVIGFTGVLGEEDETANKVSVLTELQRATSVPEHIFNDKCCINGGRVRFAYARSMAISKKVFDAAGGFMEGSTRPDIQFACRAQLMGYQMIVWNS